METYKIMKKIVKESNRLNSFYYKWCQANNISYNEMALRYVTYEEKVTTQKDICLQWSLSKQTVNSVVKKMKDEGLINFYPSENDKREISIVLAEKGEQIAKKLVEKLLEIENAILNLVSENKVYRFINDLEQFCRIAEEKLEKSIKEDSQNE